MIGCKKTSKLVSCLCSFCDKKNNLLEKYLSPLLLLAIRLMIASVFWKSGLVKFSNMESTVFLFEYDYKVPVLSPTIAAYLATFFELTCSVLLTFGLASRLATLPLIAMTLVIQLTVIQNPMHYYWLASLVTILTFGPGCISLDKIIKRFASKCSSNSQNQ